MNSGTTGKAELRESSLTLSDLFIVCSHGRRSAHETEWVHDPPGSFFKSGEWCPGGRPVTLEDLAAVLTHVGLLIGDDEFVPEAIVEQHLPFAAPSDTQIRGVYALPEDI